MSLNIATAFRLRNKMKTRIKKLSDRVEWTAITKRVGVEENTSVFDGKTFSETVAGVSLLMATLRDFNVAIDKANQVNREDLISLETLKAEIAFYESIAKKLRQVTQLYTYEHNKEGGQDKVELEYLLDQKIIVSHLEGLTKKKDDLEEKLNDSNYKTEVAFDRSVIEKLL